MSFTWVETHKGIVKYLYENKENKEAINNLLLEEGEIENSNENINPFEFFMIIYRKGDRRTKLLNTIAKRIDVETCEDTDGIPSIYSSHKFDKSLNNEIWELFNAIYKKNEDEIRSKFNNLITKENERPKKENEKSPFGATFTSLLFMINPEKFIPLDDNTKKYLKKLGYLKKLDQIQNGNEYFKLLESLRNDNKNIPNLTFKAHQVINKPTENNFVSEDKSIEDCSKFPKNQILYGPPGTGKTYNTIKLAAEIINEYNTKEDKVEIKDYNDSIKVYKKYLGDRIKFVTFHQSFSYEDFVQGLRPDTESDNMKFKKVEGVFKEIAQNAEDNLKSSIKDENELETSEKFKQLMKLLVEELTDNIEKEEEGIKIGRITRLREVEINNKDYLKSYFIYKGKGEHNGFRAYFNDLLELYKHKDSIKNRNDIENIDIFKNSIVTQHKSNFYNILKLLKENKKKLPKNVKAEKVNKQSYVLIIDEINRANISRVFGELITLIEEDKRWDGNDTDEEGNPKVKWEVTQPSGDSFVVPDNLYIIGTMNTADKSIALLDVALRRRFTFKAMYPDPSLVHEGFKDYFKNLNSLIVKELGAGRGHDLQIGHSYFMADDGNLDFINVMNNKVIPLLLEYCRNNVEDVIELVNKSLEELKEYELNDCYPLEIIKNEKPDDNAEVEE